MDGVRGLLSVKMSTQKQEVNGIRISMGGTHFDGGRSDSDGQIE